MQLQTVSVLSTPQTIEQIMRSDIGCMRMNLSGAWTDNILLRSSNL